MAAEGYTVVTTGTDLNYNEPGENVEIETEGKEEITDTENEYLELTLRSDRVIIREPSETGTYFMNFFCQGAPASSFYMDIELPYFTEICNVTINEALDAENAVSEDAATVINS